MSRELEDLDNVINKNKVEAEAGIKLYSILMLLKLIYLLTDFNDDFKKRHKGDSSCIIFNDDNGINVGGEGFMSNFGDIKPKNRIHLISSINNYLEEEGEDFWTLDDLDDDEIIDQSKIHENFLHSNKLKVLLDFAKEFFEDIEENGMLDIPVCIRAISAHFIVIDVSSPLDSKSKNFLSDLRAYRHSFHLNKFICMDTTQKAYW